MLLFSLILSLIHSSSYFQSIPSTNMVQRFEIDRQEHSKFDIANRLWSLMEGGEGAGSDGILDGVYEGQNAV